MTTQATTKTAVDQAAKDYWISFYKEYGETWVRDVPRKVKAALIADKRIAAKDTEVQPGQLYPLAHARLSTGGIRVEGIYRAGGEKRLAFVVDFDKDGASKDIKTYELG
jgi:hypothetical protein